MCRKRLGLDVGIVVPMFIENARLQFPFYIVSLSILYLDNISLIE